MPYAPILLVSLVIMILAHWMAMKSLPTKQKSYALVKKKFIPAEKFEGYRKGYIFKKGNLGLGYYFD